MVLSKEIKQHEFDDQIQILSELAPEIPVILQPISGEIEGHEDPELMEKLEKLKELGRKYCRDVRIMPRLHRILKIK